MGRTFEAAARGIAAAAGATYATIGCGANARARLREIGFFSSAATAASVGLGRPANTPVASTTILGQTRDPADAVASLVSIGTAWSTAPTAPSVFFRRAVLPNVIGAGVIWQWSGEGLIIPASGFLVLWNFGAAAGPAPDVYAVWEE